MQAVHPEPERLRAYGLGRLGAAESSEIEAHISTCDECCQKLRLVSNDTLVKLAQEASGIPADTSFEVSVIPKELINHPRYRILCQLGEGGMGTVYKAEHRIMDRAVALKVIQRKYVHNRDAVERFRNEVRMAAKLHHPNIVAAHDAEEANGIHFLVMEYVDGIALEKFVAKQRQLVPVPLACHIIRQAALGLQHAHQHGLVHRDIKPHNIMMTRKGQVKVLDFGLTRLSAESEIDMGVTAENLVVGTPDFMAPEQARNSHDVDIRTDIYALGCTLYFLLTKSVPFPCISAFEKMLNHAEKEPQPVSDFRQDIPPEVEAILQKTMAKKRENRFQTPAELINALHPFAKLNASATGPSEVVTPIAGVTETMERESADDSVITDAVVTDEMLSSETEALEPASKARSRTFRRKKQSKKKPLERWLTIAIVGTCLMFGLILWAAFKGGGAKSPDEKEKEKIEQPRVKEKFEQPKNTPVERIEEKEPPKEGFPPPPPPKKDFFPKKKDFKGFPPPKEPFERPF